MTSHRASGIFVEYFVATIFLSTPCFRLMINEPELSESALLHKTVDLWAGDILHIVEEIFDGYASEKPL